MRPYPRQQLVETKWFSNVVVSSRFQSHNLINFLAACCKHDNRHVYSATPEITANFQPAHFREHYVEQDYVWLRITGLTKTFLTIGGDDNVIALVFTAVSQPDDQVWLVFNY